MAKTTYERIAETRSQPIGGWRAGPSKKPNKRKKIALWEAQRTKDMRRLKAVDRLLMEIVSLLRAGEPGSLQRYHGLMPKRNKLVALVTKLNRLLGREFERLPEAPLALFGGVSDPDAAPVPSVEPAGTVVEPAPEPLPAPVILSVPVPAERVRPEDVTYPSREGQQKFRADVMAAYGRCVVTGCQDEAALEAAHVIPYVDQRSNVLGNGICLRADIHRLYDRDLIRITPDGVVMVSKAVKSGPYRHLHGKRVAIDGVWPDQELMAVRHRYVGRLLAADDGRLTFA